MNIAAITRKRRFHISLWARISLVVSGIIFLCFCGFGLYTARQQEQLALQEITQITRAVSANVNAAVTTEILEERLDNIEVVLIRLAMIKYIAEIIVTDNNGRVLSHIKRRHVLQSSGKTIDAPTPIYHSAKELIALGKHLNLQQTRFVQSAERLSYTSEIRRGNRIGMVMVSASLLDLPAIRQAIYVDTFYAALIAMLASTLLLNLGLRRTVKALASTTHFASSLTEQRGAQLTLASNIHEIEELVSAINSMSSDLAQQHAMLKDSEVRKNAIMQAALDCVITTDAQGMIIDFNQAAQSCFGYRLEEVLGREMAEVIIPPAMREAHRQGMARFLATGESKVLGKRIELTAVRRNLQEFPVELAIISFVSNGQRYFCGYLRDITMKKAIEAESAWSAKALMQIMREKEYQKFALDQHSIVSICDANGRITYANQKFTDISGYSSEQLLAETHALLKSGVHDPAFYREMWRCISSGEVWHGQLANRRHDGVIYWVAATIVPWLDDEGHPYQYVAIQTDITEQKAIEHALEQSRQRELETGYEIQQTLLWGEIPHKLGNLQIATHSEASQGVDGDFFGFTRYSDTCFEMLVGDVMGKGIPAAMIGAAIKNCYSQCLVQLLVENKTSDESGPQLPSPAAIVNAMHQEMTERLISLNSFVTLALYRIDLAQRSITYVNAGHTPGLLVGSEKDFVQPLLGANVPIGVQTQEVYEEVRLAIDDSTMLLAYSDGITETRDSNRQEFGEDRLAASIAESNRVNLPAAQTLLKLRNELRQFAEFRKLLDDQTAVLIAFPKTSAGEASQPISKLAETICEVIDIPWELRALGALRQNIFAIANKYAMHEEKRDGLILAAFETATNIIRHSKRPFSDSSLSCRISHIGNALEVQLLYVGNVYVPTTIAEPDFSGDSDGGFGLFIIEQAVERVIYSTPLPGVGSVRLIQLLEPRERVSKFPDLATTAETTLTADFVSR